MIKDYDYSSLGMTVGLFPYRLPFTSNKTQEIYNVICTCKFGA